MGNKGRLASSTSTPEPVMTAALEDQIVHDFTPGRVGKVDALLESANRLGHDAKQAAIQHVVRPTLQAARNAGEVIEDRARQASTAVQGGLSHLQEKALESPRRTLAYAFGVGILIGLLLNRRA